MPVVSPPPLLLRTVAVVVLVAGTAMVLLGAVRLGATTDEPFHVERYNNYRDTGWYITDTQDVHGRPGTEVSDQYVYGPATMTLLQTAGRVAGVEDSAEAGTTAADYRFRHLGVGVLGLVGLLAVAALTRRILGHWEWGLVAAAALAATPLWTGNAMFNLKDVPVATGFTLFTLGLARLGRAEPGALGAGATTVGCLAAGLFLAVGTRPGIWPGLVTSLVAAAVVISVAGGGRRAWTVRTVGELGTGLALGLVALLASYPKVFGHPVTMAVKSATASASYADKDAPRLYVVKSVLLGMPTLLLTFVVVGALVALARSWRHRARLGAADLGVVLAGVQLLALPVASMLFQSGLNSGLRQLTFAAPAAAVLATVGMAATCAWAARTPRAHLGRAAVVLVLAALVAPTLDQASVFPYGYTYTSPVALIAGSPLPDFSLGSGRTLAADADPGYRLICNQHTLPNGTLPEFPVLKTAADCPTAAPYLARRDPTAATEPEFLAISTGTVPTNCSEVTTLTRRLQGRTVTLSRLLRCRAELPVLPASGVDLSDSGRSDGLLFARKFLLSGWQHPSVDTQNPWGPGARAVGPTASLFFRLPEDLLGQRFDLLLSIRSSRSLTATVNGVVTDVRESDQGLTLQVPPIAGGAVQVTLRSADASGLDLVLTGISPER